MRRRILITLVLSVLGGGCGRQQQPPPLGPEDYGKLAGLKATNHRALQEELARVVEDRGTPELLSQSGVAAEENAADGLLDLFPDKRVESLLETSRAIMPLGEFRFEPLRLQKAIRFRQKYDAQRVRARAALERPKCDFGIQFLAGYLADLKFIDVLWICARLEAFQAAESLSTGKVDEAVESLRVMLRMASCLAAEKCAQTRLEAAYLRTEAFVVLQAIVKRERTTRRHLEKLQEIVDGHLKDWASDADAWIGDRAAGMHAYELVRNGQLAELLTAEEMEEFSKDGNPGDFAAAAMRTVNQDELYYLTTMRTIIAGCDKPYYARAKLFDAIAGELQARRNSADFPLVAARMLLPDVRGGHATQAQDRANWEAWALALSAATGRKLPSFRINPLTGAAYDLAKYENSVVVEKIGTGKDGDEPSITVPLPK